MLTPPVAEPGLSSEPEGASSPASRRRLWVVLAVAAVLAVVAFAIEVLRPDGPPSSPPGSWSLAPHAGLGAWVDAYDWTLELGGPTPPVDVEDIDAMADAGIQTLYLQTSHRRSTSDVMEPERLEELIDRAHERDLHVVAWYLPTFLDPADDLARLVAASELRVDGLGVDIEATDVVDVAERNRRLLALSEDLRAAVGDDKVLAAITLSTVHTQVVNPAFWPDYPYAELARRYDVLMPMAYWTLRTGELRAAERYVGENIDRLRAVAGPDVPIHAIGGIADDATTEDLTGLLSAIDEREAIGGSLYDWVTSTPRQWEVLQPLRTLRAFAVLLDE
ncbi:MAG TPA: hypothetical protein VJ804_11735 [Acidimicrobiales bacterium]|nr:hypothetical protein [Acidimicrobiales bacterium]